MNPTVTLKMVKDLAAQLTPLEKKRLVEQIQAELNKEESQGEPVRRSWMEIRGIMPHPMLGEEAQQWVSRTRREGDEHRESILRRKS